MARYDNNKLVAARLRLGWSQTKLAYMVDLSEAQVCRIEKGKHQKPSTIQRMANALGITLQDLVITGNGKKH